MDCAACGKPLSVTAKFCGKCGAPVKRPTKAPEAESAAEIKHAPAEDSAETPPTPANTTPTTVDDLVVTLAPPTAPGLDDSSLLMIDLNLEPMPTQAQAQTPEATAHEAVATESSAIASDWLQRLEQHQHELKKTLEKHSLLLDFISLASQQQNHQQSQPDPQEELLHNLIEQQTQFAVQLAEVQNHLNQQVQSAVPARLPEELKLLLEKQKIEIQKTFSQNIAQNSENITSAQEKELTKVQEMLQANTLAAGAIEKNLAPLIQSVNDLKIKLQDVVKKVDDQAASRSKSGVSKEQPASDGGGGFMVFVIGMLCGLTVVLSSLAIYNFLSHEKAPTPESSAKPKAAHDAH